jgi:transcriptional regulator with XRE-family HTH domain
MVIAMTQQHLRGALAECVKRLRDEAGVSQVQLAERSGIAERTLIRRESGQSSWTTDDISAVAAGLGIQTEDLLRMVIEQASPAATHEAAPTAA